MFRVSISCAVVSTIKTVTGVELVTIGNCFPEVWETFPDAEQLIINEGTIDVHEYS